MTLSEVITVLEKSTISRVPKGFGRPCSYRGSYSSVAFEPTEDTTTEDMLMWCREALGSTFNGHKGGKYLMGPDTDVYIAFSGETGFELSDWLLWYMTNHA